MKSKKLIPIMSIGFIIVLTAIALYNMKGIFKQNIGLTIADDIAYLANVFKHIDDTAGILGFDRVKNYIDFLNIKKDGFVGSEVGSMNLIDATKWEGPYLSETPKIEEENYIILKTMNGYFIVPGDEVKLPNGKIIGKDIIWDEDSEIEQLIADGTLKYTDKPLAVKIGIRGEAPFYTHELVMPED